MGLTITFSSFKSIKGTMQTKSYRYVQMNHFQKLTASNYAIIHSRFSNGTFTKYSGIRQTRLSINNGWQPKWVFLFSFITAFSLLKHIYIHISVAVNYLLILKPWQYNKALNLTFFIRRFALYKNVKLA